MRFFSGEEIDALLDFPAVIDALAEAHRRPPAKVADTMLGDEEGSYFVRSAVDQGRLAGSKLITSTPANLYRGDLPAVQAVVVVFDTRDGRPLAVLDGTILTRWRTAADSALASRHLARPGARTLLVVGAGAMARPLARAHCASCPGIDDIAVWNRDPSRAAEVVADLAAGGLAARVAGDLAEEVRRADIISTCTRSAVPVVLGRDLPPGAHLDLVGAYTLATRETDDEAIARGRVFVDRLESALDVGDIASPIASGVLSVEEIAGDMHAIVVGTARRLSDDEITVFKNAGGGHLDLFTAEAVLRAAGAL